MFRPPSLHLDELLDLCVCNRLIDSYHLRGKTIVLVQSEYVHELSPEHARLFLQNLITYSRSNVFPGPGRIPGADAPSS